MAYYLTDPYSHSPRCYPFLNENSSQFQNMNSTRMTKFGRIIQNKTATSMLEATSESYEDRLECEKRLLRCKYLVSGNEDNGPKLAEIQANRKMKQTGLRKQSRDFPIFILNKPLITDYKIKSERANPQKWDLLKQ